MRRMGYIWLFVPVLVMLLLPWLAITFVQSDVGMAAVLLLFFGVNPICCVTVGIWAGRRIQTFWWLPGAVALLFLSGTWLLFEMGEPAFLLYAGIYCLLGTLSMVFSWILTKRRYSDE